jgi:hypothetical protein
MTLLDLIAELLLLTNSPAFQAAIDITKSFTVDQVAENNDGTIKAAYTKQDIEFALRHLADAVPEKAGHFSFDLLKIKRALALTVLAVKADGFRLREYVETLKNQFELLIPPFLMQGETEPEVDAKTNLFEGFAAMDLSFLRGFAIIIPNAHLRPHEKGAVAGNVGQIEEAADDLIKILNPYTSEQFSECHISIDARLEVLFNIKDKWTYREIESYIKEFTDVEMQQKYDQWLSRNTRLHKETNPLNDKLSSQFYIKKF